MQKFPTDRRSVFSFFGLESFDESALIQMNLFNKEIYTAKMHNYFNGNCAYLQSPPTRGRELKYFSFFQLFTAYITSPPTRGRELKYEIYLTGGSRVRRPPRGGVN